MTQCFGTELATMDQASKQVMEVNSQIQSELKRLQGQLQPLAGAWKGGASVSFMNLMQRWDQQAAKLNVALSEIAEALGQSKAAYQAQDEAQRSNFGGISGALDS